MTVSKKAVYERAVEICGTNPKPSRESRCRILFEGLPELGMDKLRAVPLPSVYGRECPTTKAQFISAISDVLAFPSLEDFNTWLCSFLPDAQIILRDTLINRFSILQKYKIIRTEFKNYSIYTNINDIGLGFLNLYKIGRFVMCGIAEPLRKVLLPWFKLPAEASLENCAVLGDAVPESEKIFSNEKEISGVWPLLCESLPGEVTKYEVYNNLKPFSKKQINSLRVKCGFKNFLLDNDYQAGFNPPDALDITSRFILCMSEAEPKRLDDSQLDIKKYVQDFFNVMINKRSNNWEKPVKFEYLERHVLTDHLKQFSGFYYNRYSDSNPNSRVLFYKILMFIAKKGGWFSSDAIAKHILYNEEKFSFLSREAERFLYVKASVIDVDDFKFEVEWGDDDFAPLLTLHFYLLARPLFKAYCYLFAALGILEITQKPSKTPVVSGGKSKPYSIYDSLDALRVTEFGKWCIGVTNERPNASQEIYEAIADNELLLVTVRGNSFERSIFLDSIGEKLGEAAGQTARWRISPRSFISGCTNAAGIEARIKKFKSLIDKNPAAHWEDLFLRVMRRTAFLKNAALPSSVFYLGCDEELFEELLADPSLSACALRAEGGHIIVPDKHKKKFFALLTEHGVACF